MKLLKKGQLEFWLDEYKATRQRWAAVLYVLIISVLLINAFIGRQDEPMNIRDTKLNENQAVGLDGMQVKMTSKNYNEKQNIIEATLEATGSTDKEILTGDEIKITGNTIRGNAKLVVIPTINNQWTVVISDLDPKFGAVQLEVSSQIPAKPGQLNDQKDDKIALFSATQKHFDKTNHDEELTPKSAALKALEKGKKDIEKQLTEFEKQIEESKKLIEYDKEKIKKLQENTKTLTKAEANNTAETIQSLRSEITSTEDFIELTKHDIEVKQDELKKLNDKKLAIESEDFKFSDSTDVQTIEPKKLDD